MSPKNKTNQKNRKLRISNETVAVLSKPELTKAHGGARCVNTGSNCPTSTEPNCQ